MIRQTRIQLMMLLLMALGLNACYFSSENPLPIKPEVDRELIGCWKTLPEKDENQEPGYLLFLEDKDGYFQVVLMENGYQYSELYRGFASEINGEKYLNVKSINMGTAMQPPEMENNYYLVHYKIINHKRLEMSLLNESLFKQAQADKKLQGGLSAGSKELIITDSTEKLAAFIQGQKLADLLDEKLTPAEKVHQLPEK